MAFAASGQDNVQDAYKALLVIVAHQRVEWQLCYDRIPSSVSELTDITLDYAEKFQIMSRSRAIDIVNDEQGFRRVAVGRHCGDSRVKKEDVQAAHERFFKAAREALH